MTRLALFLVMLLLATVTFARAAEPAGPPLYYQAPDHAPFYAAGPKQTPDGRNYVPVFEDPPVAANANPAPAPRAARRASHPLLSQSNGPAGYLTGAQKGFDGHGLPARLCR